MKQRRGSYRIAYPVEARYAIAPPSLERINPDSQALSKMSWKHGMVSDISTGGARIHGKVQVGVGLGMVLQVQFPNDFLDEMSTQHDHHEIGAFGSRVRMVEVKPQAFTKILLLGNVVNVALNTATKTFVHNIQFAGVSPRERDEIERFINLRQRYELKQRNHR